MYKLHSRETSGAMIDGFSFGIEGGEWWVFSGRLFGRDIDKENPFLKALNLKYENQSNQ